ncbi:Maspardin [Taenia crassiceps]|uniref:Maspardin n=1 Tax=Taenia crassiceps TaxID=6207 RepID=A0ABR4QM55_9CEST
MKACDASIYYKIQLILSKEGFRMISKFCEISEKSNSRVKSLILCNTFIDTYSFESRFLSKLFWMLPVSMLRMTFEYPLIPTDADEDIKTSVELAKQQTLEMSQSKLASRLTMACTTDKVAVEKLRDADITIVEVGDLDATYKRLYDGVHRAYPEAKVASIDSGGHFPFLSRYDEFAAYMRMHFEPYMNTPFFPAILEDSD